MSRNKVRKNEKLERELARARARKRKREPSKRELSKPKPKKPARSKGRSKGMLGKQIAQRVTPARKPKPKPKKRPPTKKPAGFLEAYRRAYGIGPDVDLASAEGEIWREYRAQVAAGKVDPAFAEELASRPIETVPVFEVSPVLAADPVEAGNQKGLLRDVGNVLGGVLGDQQVQIGLEGGRLQVGLGESEQDPSPEVEPDDEQTDEDLEEELAFYEDPENYPVMAAAAGGLTLLGGLVAWALA